MPGRRKASSRRCTPQHARQPDVKSTVSIVSVHTARSETAWRQDCREARRLDRIAPKEKGSESGGNQSRAENSDNEPVSAERSSSFRYSPIVPTKQKAPEYRKQCKLRVLSAQWALSALLLFKTEGSAVSSRTVWTCVFNAVPAKTPSDRRGGSELIYLIVLD
jgi:hypothetical protein